jgi:hypothetical protein
MFTTAGRDALLAGTYAPTHVGLIKTITDWRAGTVTEATYTGYARAAVTFGAAADTVPAGGRQRANTGALSFGPSSSANEDEIAYGIYSASVAGTLYAIALLDDDVPIIGEGEAAGDTITAAAHGLVADQRVFVLAAPGAVMPTGLAENTAYFVLAAGLTTDVFKLSTTSGGAAVNITAQGAAMFIPYKARTVATGATPSLGIGAVVVQL